MALPITERRVLGKIEQAIGVSDPELTSLFTMFSRLGRGEHMPAGERLHAHAWLLLAALRRWLSPRHWRAARHWAARRRLRSGPPTRLTAWLCCPLAALVLVVTIVVTAHSGAASCAGSAPAGAARHHAQINTCAPAVKTPVLGGR
jgi:hypothetical protein